MASLGWFGQMTLNVEILKTQHFFHAADGGMLFANVISDIKCSFSLYTWHHNLMQSRSHSTGCINTVYFMFWIWSSKWTLILVRTYISILPCSKWSLFTMYLVCWPETSWYFCCILPQVKLMLQVHNVFPLCGCRNNSNPASTRSTKGTCILM